MTPPSSPAGRGFGRLSRLLLASVVLATSACSQASTTTTSEARSGAAFIEEVLSTLVPAYTGPDVGGKALQDEVFADGIVTFAEYERAMTARVECLRAEGYDVEGPLAYPDGGLSLAPGDDPRLSLSFQIFGDLPAAENPADDVDIRCQSQWSLAIEAVWDAQNAPSEQEVQTWLERAWRCAAERGMPLSDPPTVDEAMLSVIRPYNCTPWEE